MKQTKTNDNYVTLQITLFDSHNKYKPMSTLIKVESIQYYKEHEQEVRTQAIQKICNQRYLTGKELKRLGYNRIKVRNYTEWKKQEELNK